MTCRSPRRSATGWASSRRATSASSATGARGALPRIRSWRISSPAVRRRKPMAEESDKSKLSAGRAKRAVRVGIVVLVAATVLAVAVFLIGQENNLFNRKNRYFVDLKSVSGIKPGNPVELDGVSVGAVDRVILPHNPAQKFTRL